MKNKQLYSITFRLFADDKPVGFENWNQGCLNYTYGNPLKRDGCFVASEGQGPPGWCGKPIPHNRKEIIDIKYVDIKFLDNEKRNREFWQKSFQFINNNMELINEIRALDGYEPLTKI